MKNLNINYLSNNKNVTNDKYKKKWKLSKSEHPKSRLKNVGGSGPP